MFVIGTVVKIPTKPACLLLQIGLVVFLAIIFRQLHSFLRELKVRLKNHALIILFSFSNLAEGDLMNYFGTITYAKNFTINSIVGVPYQVKIAR